MVNVDKELLRIKISLFDILCPLVMDAFGWKYGTDYEHGGVVAIDKNGKPVEWDKFDSVEIPSFTDEDGNLYSQINMWGDGTIEFQEDKLDGESINWAQFDVSTIVRAIYSLKKYFELKRDL